MLSAVGDSHRPSHAAVSDCSWLQGWLSSTAAGLLVACRLQQKTGTWACPASSSLLGISTVSRGGEGGFSPCHSNQTSSWLLQMQCDEAAYGWQDTQPVRHDNTLSGALMSLTHLHGTQRGRK